MTTCFKDHVEIDTLTVSTTLNPPANSVTNASFSTSSTDRLASSKAIHQKTVVWQTATASTTVATVTQNVYLFNGAGVIDKVTVRPETAPTGGDLQYTVDIQKAADASASYASILTSVVTMSSADSDNTAEDGTITTTTAAAGDALRVVITTSGSTGTQGAGASVIIVLSEEPS